MRSTFVLSVATAAAVVSAQNCNPSYNVAGSTTCYTNCNVKAGQQYVSGWTMDHTSSNFLKSLELMCDRSGANYGSFMTAAGICMAGCAGDDPELFNTEWKNACAWWAIHKNDACASETTKTTTTTQAATTTAPATTTVAVTTTASATTATTVTVTDTTTVSAAASLASGVSSIATVISTGLPIASANASVSGSSAIVNVTSGASGVVQSTPAASQTPNGANRVHLSGYAIALVATLGYLTF